MGDQARLPFQQKTPKEKSLMQQTNSKLYASAVLYFAAWILCSAIIIVDVLVVRQATLDVLTAVQGQQIERSADGEQNTTRIQAGFVIEMVDRAIIILGGIAAVAFSLYIEYYFRKGRQQGKLWSRVGRVFAITLGVMLVSILIIMIV
jgi:hypothetical protein